MIPRRSCRAVARFTSLQGVARISAVFSRRSWFYTHRISQRYKKKRQIPVSQRSRFCSLERDLLPAAVFVLPPALTRTRIVAAHLRPRTNRLGAFDSRGRFTNHVAGF